MLLYNLAVKTTLYFFMSLTLEHDFAKYISFKIFKPPFIAGLKGDPGSAGLIGQQGT